MIVRRIREHVAHHNWFAVGIDLAIVIVGVFLAPRPPTGIRLALTASGGAKAAQC